MKGKVLYCPWLWVYGMAIFPFILVKKKSDVFNERLVLHEQIHLRQQLELLILPFYILYFLNYLLNLAFYRNHDKAYLNIVFEKEAYQNDANENYLSQRKLWSFVRFL